jgi:replicative DNA helicase
MHEMGEAWLQMREIDQELSQTFSEQTLDDIERLLITGCWDSHREAVWLLNVSSKDFRLEATSAAHAAIKKCLQEDPSSLSVLVIKRRMEAAGDGFHFQSLFKWSIDNNGVITDSEIRSMIADVRSEAGRRRMIRSHAHAIRMLQDRGCSLDKAHTAHMRDMSEAMAGISARDPKLERECFMELESELHEAKMAEVNEEPRQRNLILPTPWESLNKHCICETGDMVALAGLTGEGKSISALQIVGQAWAPVAPGALFSSEMRQEQILRRRAAQALKINPRDVNTSSCWEMVDKYSRDIWIDIEQMKFDRLIQKLRMLKHANPSMAWFMVDYLTLYSYAPTHEEMSKASLAFRSIALELNMACLLLLQLHEAKILARKPEERRPRLSDIRDCGTVANDASRVWAIYRPSRFNSRMDSRLVEWHILKERDSDPASWLNMWLDKSCVTIFDGPPPPQNAVKTARFRDGRELRDEQEREAITETRRLLDQVAMEDIP